MKKLLIAILFVLMIVPVNAQSVEEEITFNGIYMMALNGDGSVTSIPAESLNGTYIVQILSDNTLIYKGEIYKPYYSNRIRNMKDRMHHRWNCWRREAKSGQWIDRYVLIGDNRNDMMTFYFSNGFGGESIIMSVYGKGSSPSPGYNSTPSPSPNYNQSTPSQGRTCAGCRGTGVCTMCQGKGGYYTNSGTYTGSGSKTWHQCSSCHGSGKCGVCYGQGTIR